MTCVKKVQLPMEIKEADLLKTIKQSNKQTNKNQVCHMILLFGN